MMQTSLTTLTFSELAAWSPRGNATAMRFVDLIQQKERLENAVSRGEELLHSLFARSRVYEIVNQNRRSPVHPLVITNAIYERILERRDVELPHVNDTVTNIFPNHVGDSFKEEIDLCMSLLDNDDVDLKEFKIIRSNIEEYKSNLTKNQRSLYLEQDNFLRSDPDAEFYTSVGNLIYLEFSALLNLKGVERDCAYFSAITNIQREVWHKINSDRTHALRFFLLNVAAYKDFVRDSDRDLNLVQFAEAIFVRKTGLEPVSWQQGWMMASEYCGADQRFDKIFPPSVG